MPGQGHFAPGGPLHQGGCMNERPGEAAGPLAGSGGMTALHGTFTVEHEGVEYRFDLSGIPAGDVITGMAFHGPDGTRQPDGPAGRACGGREVSTVTRYPPRRGVEPVLCTHCGGELQAVGEIVGYISIAGLRDYLWQHVSDGRNTCSRTYEARPYDTWAATQRIEATR